MSFNLRLPKFRRQSLSSKNGMQPKPSTSVVSNSHNLVVFHETHYGSCTSAGNQNPLVTGVQMEDGIPTPLSVSISEQKRVECEVLEILLENTRLKNFTAEMSSIHEEEEPPTPTPSRFTTARNSLYGTRHTPKSIRVVDPKEMIERSSGKVKVPSVCGDNISRHSGGSGRPSQYSSMEGSRKYKLSKLSLGNLRFPEPVEKHVKTYMTSRKQNFSAHSDYAICLWHPFSSIDLDGHVQEKHCILGDVGKFNSRGGFDVMFNIFMTMEENRMMNYLPPTTFTPFQSTIRHWSRVPGEESHFFMTYDLEYRDDGKKNYKTYTFQSIKKPERPGSAILVAPGCAAKELNKSLISSIRGYLSTQVESWYDPDSYPNQQHENLSVGSLNLICTCYKSKVWAAAAKPQSVTENQEQLKAKLSRSPDDADVYEWDVHPSFKVNHGSSKRDVSKIDYTVAVEVCPLGLPSNESTLGRVLSASLPLSKRPFSSFFSLR